MSNPTRGRGAGITFCWRSPDTQGGTVKTANVALSWGDSRLAKDRVQHA